MNLSTVTGLVEELTNTWNWTEEEIYEFSVMYLALYNAQKTLEKNNDE